MSKTTFFKRIALTAIAALGFGMLSVAPSQAVVQNLVVAGANGTANLSSIGGSSDSRTAATLSVTALLEANDSITVAFVEKSKPVGATAVAFLYYRDSTTATGKTTVDSTTATGVTTLAGAATLVNINSFIFGTETGTGLAAGVNQFRIRNAAAADIGYIGANFQLQLDSTSARIKGTYTYTITVKSFNAQGTLNVPASTTSTDVSIVVADTAANVALVAGTIDPSKTTAVLNTGTVADGGFSAIDSSIAVVATADGTVRGSIQVKSMTSTSLPAPESVTVTITGPGLVRDRANTAAAGKSLTVLGTAGNTIFDIISDGTAGVASIVVKTTTVTFAVKNVTFYAKAAKTITVSAYQPVIKVGANTNVVRATALDADGNVWGGAAYIYASAAADALIGSSATPVACSFSSTLGLHECPVAGTAEGTANLKVIDAATVALATATSDAVAVRVSTGVASTVKLSFDKATYAPGEKAQLRIQVLDGAGLAMPAVTITNGFTSTGITTSSQLGAGGATAAELAAFTFDLSGWTSATSNLNAGHKTYVVYMPATAGAVTISATASTGIALAGRVALTATATVVDTSQAPVIAAADAATDAAAEAIDAANAATDAANLAAEAADAATVAAEEARDAADAATAAVEALATEVATLMAALKAQITTLANTVAKIAKKVKA